MMGNFFFSLQRRSGMTSHFMCAVAVPSNVPGEHPKVFHSFCKVTLFFQVEVGKTISIHFHPYLCLKSRVFMKSREFEDAGLFHGAPYKFTYCFISSPVTSCSHRWGLVTLLMSCANWISSCVHTGMHLILKSLRNQSFWPLDSR